jgi:hypothetical protein
MLLPASIIISSLLHARTQQLLDPLEKLHDSCNKHGMQKYKSHASMRSAM